MTVCQVEVNVLVRDRLAWATESQKHIAGVHTTRLIRPSNVISGYVFFQTAVGDLAAVIL